MGLRDSVSAAGKAPHTTNTPDVTCCLGPQIYGQPIENEDQLMVACGG